MLITKNIRVEWLFEEDENDAYDSDGVFSY